MPGQDFTATIRPVLQITFAATLLLAASASSRARTAEPVTLRFAWQPGMECAVSESTFDLLKDGPPEVETWTYVVAAASGGLRISPRDSVSTAGDPADPWSPTLDRILEIANSAAYFVSAEGRYRGHENANPLVARMRLLRAKAPDARKFDTMMERFADPDVWEQMLRVDWLDFAGDPRLRELKLAAGKSQEVRALQTNLSPVMDGAYLFLDTRVTAGRPAPCGDAPAVRCVTLTLKQSPSDAAMRESVRAFNGIDPSGLLLYFALRDFTKTTTMELEPDTSVPHALRVEMKTNKVRLHFAEDESTPMHWRVERRYRCAVPP